LTDPDACSGSLCGEVLLSPIPGQQFGDPLGRMIRQPREHIDEPSLRVDVVELGGLDERVDGGGAMAAFVGACEGPILSPERNLALILPISGRMSSFTIAGIRCTGKVRVAFRSSDARAVSSCTSR
jgi:hypothetical protein